MRIFIKIFTVIIVIWLLKVILNIQPNVTDDSYSRELSWIELGKEEVKLKLKDASSAQFRNVYFNNNGTPVTCGEVNSKNSFGAYGGYQKFISAGKTLTVLEEEVTDGIVEVWNKHCVKPNLELQANLESTPNEGTPIVIKSDIGKYFVLEKNLKVNANKNLRSIVTKRVGSSGTTYSKRLYDCKNNTVKYLGTGDSIDAMNKSKEDANMSPIFTGSIAYEVGLIICSSNN